MKFLAWPRTSRARITTAAAMWALTCLNVVGGVMDFRDRYEVVSRTRAARVWCEARGGSYGATQGKPELCYRENVSADTSDKNAPTVSQ
jgi:hypothetical protein